MGGMEVSLHNVMRRSFAWSPVQMFAHRTRIGPGELQDDKNRKRQKD
jgi:hypothetical protein